MYVNSFLHNFVAHWTAIDEGGAVHNNENFQLHDSFTTYLLTF